MRRFFLMLIFIIPIALFSQEDNNSITIQANADVYIKANAITFNVRLKQEDSSPKLVFAKHKEAEKKLINLISQYDVSDSSVSYSLMSISKGQNHKREPIFRTAQTVIIKLDSVVNFTKFQISLLENDFFEFNSVFSANNLLGVKELGYKKALSIAMEDAQLIAKAMNKKLGEIIGIETRTSSTPYIESGRLGRLPPPRGEACTIAGYSNDEGLTKIDQYLKSSTTLKVKFKIID